MHAIYSMYKLYIQTVYIRNMCLAPFLMFHCLISDCSWDAWRLAACQAAASQWTAFQIIFLLFVLSICKHFLHHWNLSICPNPDYLISRLVNLLRKVRVNRLAQCKLLHPEFLVLDYFFFNYFYLLWVLIQLSKHGQDKACVDTSVSTVHL